MEYGNKLNPERSLRTPHGIKGTRQKVIVAHSPSEVDQNQDLLDLLHVIEQYFIIIALFHIKGG